MLKYGLTEKICVQEDHVNYSLKIETRRRDIALSKNDNGDDNKSHTFNASDANMEVAFLRLEKVLGAELCG